MGGKGSKVLEKEGMKLRKGIRRSEKKFESSRKKGKGLPKCVNKIESFDKTKKSSEMDIDEEEYVEEGKSGPKLLHGKKHGKGATCETR
jgi:hypothetical protein